jgi:hypothetical protein
MSDNNSNVEPSISALVIGQGAECDILKSWLSGNPIVSSAVHETSGHHAFGEIRSHYINTIFIDPYSLYGGLDEATFIIFQVRLEFPEIVFVLFLDTDKVISAEQDLFTGEGDLSSHLKSRYNDLFAKERSRLSHYFRLSKNVLDPNFSNSLDAVLRSCVIWHKAALKTHSQRAIFEYDVALSFAGEDRKLADDIANELRKHGVRVFYDSFEQANLWGKDLFAHLHEIYSKKSRFCIMLVSEAYSSKMWTVHERKSAQSRALKERDNEYILPVRIDNTELPGLPDTIAYIDISQYGYLEICRLFIQKLGGSLSTLS